jgi:dipeptide/tripeptide permease
MIVELLDVSLWVLLAGVIVGELYLFLVRKWRPWLQVAYFALVLLVCIAGWYLFEPPTVAQTLEPLKFAWYLLFILAAPLTLFAVGLRLISRLRSPLIPHGVLAVWALAIALVWPTSVLFTHCAVGLGCF